MPAGIAELQLLIRAKDQSLKVLDKNRSAIKKTAAVASKAGMAAGAAVSLITAAAIKMGVEFESSMAEVRTLLPDLDDEGFAKLTASVLEFSKQTGVATDEAVPALYQAISAGVPQENVFEFMKVASEAAIGGVTDLETAVDGITSVVNAYGAEVLDAQKASDVMFTAVKLGKTDFTQLSASLFNVIPTAASLGISFEQVAAGLAVMTAQGTPTSVATTQLRALMVEASKAGSKLSNAILEVSGKSFADLIKEGMNVSDILNLVQESTAEATANFQALFNDDGIDFKTFSAGLKGVEDALSNVDKKIKTGAVASANSFSQALVIMGNEAGISTDRIKLMAKDADRVLEGLSGRTFAELKAEGFSVDKMFKLLNEELGASQEGFSGMFGSVEALNAALAISGDKAQGFQDALAEMEGASGATNKAFETIADTMKFKVEKKMNEFKVALTDIGLKIVTTAPALALIGPAMAGLSAAMPAMGAGLGLLTTAWSAMGVAARIAWAAATGPVGITIAVIAAAIAIGVLIWKNWDTIKAKAIEVFGFIERIFRSKWAWLLPGGVMIKAILFLKDNWREIWESIRDTTIGIFSTLKGLANDFLKLYLGIFNAIIGAWNSLEFKLPSTTIFGKKIGGGTISTPNIPLIPIPSFDQGGVVPGRRGRPVLVQALGGERFIAPGQRPNGLMVVNHFHGDILGVDDLDRRIEKTVLNAARRGGFAGVFVTP